MSKKQALKAFTVRLSPGIYKALEAEEIRRPHLGKNAIVNEILARALIPITGAK